MKCKYVHNSQFFCNTIVPSLWNLAF